MRDGNVGGEKKNSQGRNSHFFFKGCPRGCSNSNDREKKREKEKISNKEFFVF